MTGPCGLGGAHPLWKALRGTPFNPTERFVLAYYVAHEGPRGAWAKWETLEAEVGASRSQIWRAIANLRDAGVLESLGKAPTGGRADQAPVAYRFQIAALDSWRGQGRDFTAGSRQRDATRSRRRDVVEPATGSRRRDVVEPATGSRRRDVVEATTSRRRDARRRAGATQKKEPQDVGNKERARTHEGQAALWPQVVPDPTPPAAPAHPLAARAASLSAALTDTGPDTGDPGPGTADEGTKPEAAPLAPAPGGRGGGAIGARGKRPPPVARRPGRSRGGDHPADLFAPMREVPNTRAGGG